MEIEPLHAVAARRYRPAAMLSLVARLCVAASLVSVTVGACDSSTPAPTPVKPDEKTADAKASDAKAVKDQAAKRVEIDPKGKAGKSPFEKK